ncbi:hypothetical protein A6R68_02605 [Neotoma lepida]|uniref:HECT-type E3 ubiquitin transferase n=1 Tax=Neotoma lepida TaxID=56216 RepID=A0A1A6GT72_NEOLE|nr:hypothetical protein A6R68_02605 [Neotoma lepida]
MTLPGILSSLKEEGSQPRCSKPRRKAKIEKCNNNPYSIQRSAFDRCADSAQPGGTFCLADGPNLTLLVRQLLFFYKQSEDSKRLQYPWSDAAVQYGVAEAPTERNDEEQIEGRALSEDGLLTYLRVLQTFLSQLPASPTGTGCPDSTSDSEDDNEETDQPTSPEDGRVSAPYITEECLRKLDTKQQTNTLLNLVWRDSASEEVFTRMASICHTLMVQHRMMVPKVYGAIASGQRQSSMMPFTLEELILLSRCLRDACLGIIKLAYPETKPEVREEYVTAFQSIGVTTNSEMQQCIQMEQKRWVQLFKVITNLVKMLKSRDTRRNFCPPNHWLSEQEDIKADKERQLAILTELPFVVPFEERVKALYENMLVELPFAGFFLSKLLGTSADVDIHHLASLDPEVYKNLLFLKSYEEDVEELGLNFTVVNNDLGEAQVVELKFGGKDIPVTGANRIAYIHLVADYRLNKQIRPHCLAFRQGLANVVSLEWLRMFDQQEIQELYPAFCIHNGGSDLERLPTASTCMNLLKLPEFYDEALLRSKLLYAIEGGYVPQLQPCPCTLNICSCLLAPFQVQIYWVELMKPGLLAQEVSLGVGCHNPNTQLLEHSTPDPVPPEQLQKVRWGEGVGN